MSLRVATVMPIPFLAILALACKPPQGEPAPDAASGEIAARVDGVPISVAEVDAWIKEQLFLEKTRNRSPALLFEAREEALARMVRERILEAEAARRNLSADEVLEQEVAALGPVSDEEVAAFHANNPERVGSRSLEELSDTIRSFLEGQRRQDALRAIVERADIVQELEAPRFEVASDGPSLGPASAPVTIVEFSDFQCPYCRRAADVVKQVRERYGDDVRVVYKQFPLEQIHAQARGAAEASLCADDQQRFWDYHDKLFENSRKLAPEDLVRYAGEIELDVPRFEQCVADRSHRQVVDGDIDLGKGLGVSGTPAFFVNGIMLSGSRPLEEFTAVIDAELQRLGSAGG
jgi:protein-disulfide isomerase